MFQPIEPSVLTSSFQLYSLYTMVLTTAKASMFTDQVLSFHKLKIPFLWNTHNQIFNIFDTDGNGIVDFREFMMAMATTALFIKLQAIWEKNYIERVTRVLITVVIEVIYH